MGSNPWSAKARDLDRYRWMLLRERHGVFGSGVRFLREAIGDWLFGVRAKMRLAKSVEVHPCDFLLLQSAPKVLAFQRKKKLIAGIRERGYTLTETALQPPRVVLRNAMLRRPPFSVPTRYFGLAAHAQWLVEHYQPKVLLNDRNGSLHAPFLRLALNACHRPLVHLAHATTVEGSRRLGMNDYDFYFLFGQSSLDALRARNLRLGSSLAVLAGSHMIDDSYDLAIADPHLHTLLVLGVGPDKEKEGGYRATYDLLRNWAATNPGYRVLVKAHPRSCVPFWQDASTQLSNVHVLPKECTLAEALARVSIVVNIMSNAVIEAALARRPVLHVNASRDPDIFEQARFFGPCIDTAEKISERLKEIENNYSTAVAASVSFAEYHLAQGSNGLESCLTLLENIVSGETCAGVPLMERLGK
jgi:hypothetical protein